MFQLAKPIFIKDKEQEMNTFAAFRTAIVGGKGTTLRITAISFYQLRINGRFVAFGPARAAKNYARVDVIDLDPYLTDGKNEILVTVAGYNCRALSTAKQSAFLIAEITRDGAVLAATGRDFEGFAPTCKLQKTERYSVQRHFSEIWDFTAETDLTAPEFAAEVAVQSLSPKLLDRVAPYPYYEDTTYASASCTGSLTFDESLPYNVNFYSFQPSERWGRFEADEIVSRPYEWIQRHRQTVKSGETALPLSLKANEYAIFDLSRIEVGFFLVGAEAHETADLILAFTEDSSPTSFAFTDMHTHNVLEYKLPAGKKLDLQSFEPYVARYVILAVKEGSLTLDKFGIKSFTRDFSEVEIPEIITDPALRAIYRGGIRTFAHNAVDLPTDCPSRERTGWLCDSYFTSKTEFELYKNAQAEEAFLENYRLFENEGEYPEGMIPMCYPSDMKDNGEFIPQWSMWYVIEVADYLCNRAPEVDREIFRPTVEALLAFYKRHENADGLLEKLPSWGFVEWSIANQWTQDVSYPTNFLYAEVLAAAYRIFGNEEYLRRSREVQRVAVEQSFNGKTFLDHAIRNEAGELIRQEAHCSEACQYYAILFGGIDWKDDRYAELRRLVLEVFGAERSEAHPEIAEINAFIGAYLRLEALLKLEEYDLILRDVKDFFGCMEQETGTLWEYRQRHGSRDHGFASYALVAMMVALKNR